MKYKLINKTTGEERICEKIVIEGLDYYVSDKMPNVGSPFYDKELNCVAWRTDNSLVHKNDVEIIATNNPSIDIPKVVNEVEIMANLYCKEMDRLAESHDFNSFKYAYNKSQETHPFGEEDVIEFLNWIRDNTVFDSAPKPYHRKTQTRLSQEELLQLWKEQRPKILYYEQVQTNQQDNR